MKFSVGYQLFSDSYFIDNIIERKDHISEVYFSWGSIPNGRNNQIMRSDLTLWEAQEKQFSDLKELSEENLNLNLLFNATCYGKDSLSKVFFHEIGDTVSFLFEKTTLKTVTTTSPVIAGFIKANFPDIEVRASVNMCIGTEEGMKYVADCFDSFYLKREYNRDFAVIHNLKAWCDENGKTLYALANSGCLNNCSAHTFHDNLVSHESEITKADNGFIFQGVCKKFLSNPDNLHALLDYTGFIRPEDIDLYEGLFPSMKLATRVHADPVKVLSAYIDRRKHIGSVLDLLEPNHTPVIYPWILENSRIKAQVHGDKLVYSNVENALIKLEDDRYVNK